MTTFEIILIVMLAFPQVIAATSLIIFACKKDPHFTKHIVTETRVDEIQRKIAEANLAELKRYNDNAEKANQEHTDSVKNITEALQDLMGVNDGD